MIKTKIWKKEELEIDINKEEEKNIYHTKDINNKLDDKQLNPDINEESKKVLPNLILTKSKDYLQGIYTELLDNNHRDMEKLPDENETKITVVKAKEYLNDVYNELCKQNIDEESKGTGGLEFLNSKSDIKESLPAIKAKNYLESVYEDLLTSEGEHLNAKNPINEGKDNVVSMKAKMYLENVYKDLSDSS